MISLSALLYALLTLVVVGLIFWVIDWFISYANPPEPFKNVARVILALGAMLLVVGALISLLNGRALFVG